MVEINQEGKDKVLENMWKEELGKNKEDAILASNDVTVQLLEFHCILIPIKERTMATEWKF